MKFTPLCIFGNSEETTITSTETHVSVPVSKFFQLLINRKAISISLSISIQNLKNLLKN